MVMVKYVNLLNKNYIFSTGLGWSWLIIVILIIDFFSKQFIINNFQLYETLYLLPCFSLTYVQNTGAAFNFLSNQNGWQCWFFIFITIIICVILVLMMYAKSFNEKLSNIAYAMVIGGALGNLCDRINYCFVIDFIDIYIYNLHFPIFNIADFMIFIGTIFIVTINYNKKSF
ncbi:Lipoprotein signal peptidase [Candidatus Arsenophonus lipoptenae]|uniref:Lipoprotein signal peptidase n=1 Tax=Candidatus Arsenophonus lipoptenae TaxID=634113 RepID=A0A109QE56_9GAMM|nr:signal peptidase II [Candidatus Arsenophonus lipoptenae]AMA64846.1 Lipoprotein signal peptidase [Candidatus Arsenophonus lipoptenae]